MKSKTGAIRHNEGKPRWDLLPPLEIGEIVKVFTNGFRKYGENNWARGFRYTDVYASAMRHLQAWRTGKSTDPESGCHHLAHCAANLIFLMWFERTGFGEDNRQTLVTGQGITRKENT